MAHPFQSSRADAVAQKRAGAMMKAAGGKAKHSDAAADKKLIAKMISAHEAKEHAVQGYARGGRLEKYARGGKTKKKPHTQVNIAVVAPHGGHHPGMGGSLGGAGGPPPGLPPGLPPGGPPIGGPPMGGPPGMVPPPGMMPPPGMKPPGMMKAGGRVKHTGSVLTGVGRKEIAAIQKRKKK